MRSSQWARSSAERDFIRRFYALRRPHLPPSGSHAREGGEAPGADRAAVLRVGARSPLGGFFLAPRLRDRGAERERIARVAARTGREQDVFVAADEAGVVAAGRELGLGEQGEVE